MIEASRGSRVMWVLPLAGLVVAIAAPVGWYAQKARAEGEAAEALAAVHALQQTVRASAAGYAGEIDMLSAPCDTRAGAAMEGILQRLRDAGYTLAVRAAEGAVVVGSDCRQRPIVSEYYAAVQPASARSAGQRAFALRGDGRIFLFYDGVAPRERDMSAGGLATPLDAAAGFRIP